MREREEEEEGREDVGGWGDAGVRGHSMTSRLVNTNEVRRSVLVRGNETERPVLRE